MYVSASWSSSFSSSVSGFFSVLFFLLVVVVLLLFSNKCVCMYGGMVFFSHACKQLRIAKVGFFFPLRHPFAYFFFPPSSSTSSPRGGKPAKVNKTNFTPLVFMIKEDKSTRQLFSHWRVNYSLDTNSPSGPEKAVPRRLLVLPFRPLSLSCTHSHYTPLLLLQSSFTATNAIMSSCCSARPKWVDDGVY